MFVTGLRPPLGSLGEFSEPASFEIALYIELLLMLTSDPNGEILRSDAFPREWEQLTGAMGLILGSGAEPRREEG